MFFVNAIVLSKIWTNTRLYCSDNLRPQLWLRQDGELQGFYGNCGSGRSFLQTVQTRKHQQVCLCLVRSAHSFQVFLNKLCACFSFKQSCFCTEFEEPPMRGKERGCMLVNVNVYETKGPVHWCPVVGGAHLIGVIVLEEEC